MNRKRLIKSIIGTVVIYGVLVAFLFILSKTIYLGLGELWVFPVSCVVCSIVAGVLFKGEIYSAVWSAGAVIFCAVIPNGWDFSVVIGMLMLYLAPLLIPFFIVKSVFLSLKIEEKEKSGLDEEQGQED